jgi:Nucleotidyl transferase AbiEii toxin, Type IV TA system
VVLAEKIVTALQRGPASTRWRDFGDIYQLTGHHVFHAKELRQALQAVASYRHVDLSGLDDALDGYAEIGQLRCAAWRRKLQLTDSLPANFGDALDALQKVRGTNPERIGKRLCLLGPGPTRPVRWKQHHLAPSFAHGVVCCGEVPAGRDRRFGC